MRSRTAPRIIPSRNFAARALRGFTLVLLIGLLIVPASAVRADGDVPPPTPNSSEPALTPDSVQWLGTQTTLEEPPAFTISAGDVTLSGDIQPAGGSWFNRNLIANPGAEQPWYNGALPGWNQYYQNVSTKPYGTTSGVTLTDMGPANRGAHFFSPAPPECDPSYPADCDVSATQQIKLVGIEALIDSGQVGFALSGYFGGIYDEDTAQLSLEFLDANNIHIPNGSSSVGYVTATDRRFKNGLLYRGTGGLLPRGTRSVMVNLTLFAYQRAFVTPSGMADNLSLVLNMPRVYLPVTLSSPGNQTSAPAQPTAPAAPSSLSSTPNGVTELNLSWTDNASNESGYRVERKLSTEASYKVMGYLNANQASFSDAGMTPGAQVAYRVLAYNAAGDSTPATLTTTLPPAPITKPAKPASCWISNLSATSVVFSWTDSSNNEQYFPLWIAQQGVNGGLYRQLANIEANATSVTIVDLLPGVPTALSISAKNQAQPGESDDCYVNFTPLAQTGGIKLINASSYPIAYLTINGVQEFPVSPMGVLTGSYYQVQLNPGTYTIEARTGFWQDQTHRFDMYTHTFTATVTAGQVKELRVEDISIQNLLTQFDQAGKGYGYWEGTYWDANMICRTAAFRFYPDKTYNLYLSNQTYSSGTYALETRKPSIFATTFTVSGVAGQSAMLLEPYGYFYLKNGPPSWAQIEYHYKPQGYVANPFCP